MPLNKTWWNSFVKCFNTNTTDDAYTGILEFHKLRKQFINKEFKSENGKWVKYMKMRRLWKKHNLKYKIK